MEEESQRLLLGQRKSPSPSGLGSSSFCVDSDHHVVEEERQQVRLEGVPPPPPPPLPTTSSQYTKISSLDFERVVNEFSIQATRDRFLLDGEIQQQQQQQQLQQQRKQGLFHEGYGSTMSEITHSTSAFHLMTPKKRKRKPRRTTGRTATRWFLSTAVGLLTGLTTILIATCTESFVAWRAKILDEWTREDEEFPLKRHYIFVIFTIINLLMATSASVLCVYWAPEGSGSGIPEVKAYLNGVRVKRFSSLSLFFVKIVGTVLSVSSALAIGMEGPLIHVGAIIGASCSKLSGVLIYMFNLQTRDSRWKRRLWSWLTMDLSHFATDAERRDLISIGASVGFAASFGAPIGGLLFILDDISSYFSKSMFLRTLVANAIGTFCLALHHGDLSNYSIINLGTYVLDHEGFFVNRFEEIPLYFLVGAVGGALGGLFSLAFEFLSKNTSIIKASRSRMVLQVAILSLVTSVVLFHLPYLPWACKKIGAGDDIGGRRFFCQADEVNEMATIILGGRDDAIKRILTSPSQFQKRTLCTVGFVFFGLMTLTFGSSLPSGIFTPTVLSGAALGAAAGLHFQETIDPEITPATFALLGVAALLAGVQRSTVSLSVILVEGTGQIKVLLPVIITVLVARYVAEFFHEEGIYETSIRLKGYPYLDHEDKKRYDIFQVKDIMSKPAHTIGPRERAHKLVTLLKKSNHHGFPVADPESGKFLGLVRRDQIIALLECGVFEDEDDCSYKSSPSNSVSPSPARTPTPGVSKSPYMHWAYHINDDRYDHVARTHEEPLETKRHQSTWNENDGDENDEHIWLRTIHENMAVLPVSCQSADHVDTAESYAISGDDSLPPITVPKIMTASTRGGQGISLLADTKVPRGFADVTSNKYGNLFVSWLHPACHNRYVNVADVMNRGTYCVREFCPVSKAHFLFTSMGLRHLVVLGAETGGSVVGVLSRANFLRAHIQDRTGLDMY